LTRLPPWSELALSPRPEDRPMLRFACPLLTAPAVLFLLPFASPAQEKKLLPQEAAVRAFILENVDDPKSVEFARWGPHDLGAKLGAQRKHAFLFNERRLIELLNYGLDRLKKKFDSLPDKPYPLVRVRFRLANRMGGRELVDAVFVVVGKTVLPFAAARDGDEWMADMKERIESLGRLFRERPGTFPGPGRQPGFPGPPAEPKLPSELPRPKD
jgi:hypothetical protein